MKLAAAVGAASLLAACAPVATLPEGMPATVVATYRCDGDGALFVTFDNRAAIATVRFDGRSVALRQERAASGIRYAAAGYELRGKGGTARFTRPGGRTSDCVTG